MIRGAAGDSALLRVVDGGVTQADGTGTFVNSTAFKAAGAWAANDFAHSFNGAAVVTDGSVTLPTVTTLQMGGLAGSVQGNCHIREFHYWPERKTNAFLVQKAT